MDRPASVVLVALLALGLGWWMGRSSAIDAEWVSRLGALEERIDALPGSAPRRAKAQRPEDPAQLAKLDLTGAPSRGPDDAPVTIVEFTDFQCPYCLRANPTLERLREEYPDQVRLVFKHFPLGFHQQALNAHRAVLSAGIQGKFWEMHDLIFANPSDLDPEAMKAHARRLDLDVVQFESDFVSERLGRLIQEDIAEGRQAGVRGTPAFFVNGRLLAGAQPYEVFKRLVEEELAGAS